MGSGNIFQIEYNVRLAAQDSASRFMSNFNQNASPSDLIIFQPFSKLAAAIWNHYFLSQVNNIEISMCA